MQEWRGNLYKLAVACLLALGISSASHKNNYLSYETVVHKSVEKDYSKHCRGKHITLETTNGYNNRFTKTYEVAGSNEEILLLDAQLTDGSCLIVSEGIITRWNRNGHIRVDASDVKTFGCRDY